MEISPEEIVLLEKLLKAKYDETTISINYFNPSCELVKILREDCNTISGLLEKVRNYEKE